MDLDVSADLLYKALKEMDEIELNILNEEASVKHIFTDNFEQNMERMLNKAKRKEWFSSTTVIRKAAMAAIIVLAGLTAVTVTVPAFRKKFIYMLEKTFPKFFEIELDKERTEEPLKKKDFTLDKVPLGMRLVKRVEGEREVYQNKMGGFLSFKYGEMPGAAVWADIGSLEIQPDKLSGLWQKEKIIGGIKQLTWKDADFIFSISTNENNLDLYTLADQIKRKWTKYVPTYIPNGFHRTYFDDDSENSFVYEKGDFYIAIDYEDVDAGSISFDNEHTIIEKKKFSGHPAYFTRQMNKKDKTNGITWYDNEYLFGVTTNLSEEETFKVAQGLKKCNKDFDNICEKYTK